MESKNKALTLRIRHADGREVEAQSELESVIVGSGAGAAVMIPDPKVSNLHVMLKVAPNGSVTAIDLGSEHGTRVGDNVLKDPVPLRSGDTLKMGSTQVTVLFGETAQVQPPAGATALAAGPLHQARPGAQTNRARRGLAGTGKNSAILFNDPLPPEATPAEGNRVLQVALLWGDTLIDVQHFADGVPVTIGQDRGNAFNVFTPSVGGTYTLATGKDKGAEINIPSDAGVVVASGSSQRSKEQLRQDGKLKAAAVGRGDAIELGMHDRVQISLENVAFIVRYVRPSAALPVNRLEEADFTFFKVVSISLMAAAAVVLAILLTPNPGNNASDDIFQNPTKYTRLLIKPEKKVELKKPKKLSGVEEGAKAEKEEGKFGKQEAKKPEADPSKKGAPIVNADKREEDRKKVMSAGLLSAAGAGAASNVFGPGGLGTGINNSLGGLRSGAGMGDAQGVGGLGSRGTGPGGGGAGLGLGGLGTKGRGAGSGGHGGIDLGGKGKELTRIIPGKTTVVGGLDRDVIMKVVRRHQNEIKYCYESELSRSPDLAGKVAVMWTIDPTGAVSDANVAESSLGNNSVESCMLSKIRRWRFPEPKGGGVVSVNFPWVFNAAGAGE